MITAVVQFTLPEPISADKAQELFAGSAPRYRDLPGLIRKYYLLAADGKTAGGVYLWESREDAERLYTAEWRKFIVEKYGTGPTVAFFETPVIVDNTVGQIITG